MHAHMHAYVNIRMPKHTIYTLILMHVQTHVHTNMLHYMQLQGKDLQVLKPARFK